MQTKLISIGDKWLEVRKKAQEAAANFLGGLLGSSDPVFTDAAQLTSGSLNEDDKPKEINPEDYEIDED